MKKFLFALQFLTIIPIPRKKATDENELLQAVIYFPLVGALLGLILVGINMFLTLLLSEQLLTNVILVTLLIILTGGLHLDGLADTFDALSSRETRVEMLNIMREPSVGTMGVLALISVILLKLSFLSSLDPSVKNISLIMMCILSRWSLVLSMFLFPYAREEGKAKIFIQGMNFKKFALSTSIALSCAIALLGLKGLAVHIIVAIFVFWAGKLMVNKIGGMTGDTLGAIDELAEPLVLLAIIFLTKTGL